MPQVSYHILLNPRCMELSGGRCMVYIRGPVCALGGIGSTKEEAEWDFDLKVSEYIGRDGADAFYERYADHNMFTWDGGSLDLEADPVEKLDLGLIKEIARAIKK